MTMPWKETDVMEQRFKFVLQSLDPTINFTELCTEYNISTKTGYKWKERFLKNGLAGLKDKSSRPHSHPKTISLDVTCDLLRIKKLKAYWGSQKILDIYSRSHPDEYIPSRASLDRIFQKAGYVSTKRPKRKYRFERIQNRVTPTRPNDLWTVDFKGWWYTSKRERCEPLTVRDEYSKYILSIKILERGDTDCVKREFERLFTTYGIPLFIRSDNGPPFACHQSLLGLTRLAAWWWSLGIQLDRIDPGKPYQNGAHERMHRDMKQELEGKINGDLKLHQSIFDVWRDEFNRDRPHAALAMKRPAEVYKPSERLYTGTVFEIQYPSGYIPRKVNNRGVINYKGHRIFICNSLSSYYLGLQLKNGHFIVWFGNHQLGEIDLNSFLFQSIVSLEKARTMRKQ